MAKVISDAPSLGKYPAQEKGKGNHLGLKIGLGVGIPTLIVGGFFGYKALTSNNPRNTDAEIQAALRSKDQKVQKVDRNYAQEAIEELNSPAGVKYQDEGWLVSGRELTKYSKEDFPKIDQSTYNRLLSAVINYVDQDKKRFPGGEIIVSKIRELKPKRLILEDGSNPDVLHEIRIHFTEAEVLSSYYFSIVDDDGKISVSYHGSNSPWK